MERPRHFLQRHRGDRTRARDSTRPAPGRPAGPAGRDEASVGESVTAEAEVAAAGVAGEDGTPEIGWPSRMLPSALAIPNGSVDRDRLASDLRRDRPPPRPTSRKAAGRAVFRHPVELPGAGLQPGRPPPPRRTQEPILAAKSPQTRRRPRAGRFIEHADRHLRSCNDDEAYRCGKVGAQGAGCAGPGIEPPSPILSRFDRRLPAGKRGELPGPALSRGLVLPVFPDHDAHRDARGGLPRLVHDLDDEGAGRRGVHGRGEAGGG